MTQPTPDIAEPATVGPCTRLLIIGPARSN